MTTTRRGPSRRALRRLATTLVLALLAVLLLAGSALAAAKPGAPTAKAPKNTIAATKPTFSWSKAPRAAKYEVRVYKGSTLQVKKTGLTKLSWKAVKALPTNVSLTWKVRASNARGVGAWSRSLTFKIVPPSSEKTITAFSFEGLAPQVLGVIDETLHTIAVGVPYGTDVSALVATFTTTGASVRVGATPQVSGTTPNNFTGPVTYTVTAADSSAQDYTVTVTIAASPAKAITAFSFTTPAATGVINETLHTIAVSVPFGTTVTALAATFTTTGAWVAVGGAAQTSGTTPNDFTSHVHYIVTAADATTADYEVTVTVAANPATADLTGLALSGSPTGYTFESGTYAYTGVTVPNATESITVTPTGAGVITVNTVEVASGDASGAITLTAGTPQTITVVATETGKSAKTYTIQVTRGVLVIGQAYKGGTIAYILQSGDPGYSETVQHGLIAATADQTPADIGIQWALPAYQSVSVPGAHGTAIGSGADNTTAIIAQNGAGDAYAAGLARAYTGGGYNDWFLPSSDEVNQLYLNRVAIGGFHTTSGDWPWYWSSSQNADNANYAWYRGFGDGVQSNSTKNPTLRVRAVRAF